MLNTDLKDITGTALVGGLRDEPTLNAGGSGFEDVVLLTRQVGRSVGLDLFTQAMVQGSQFEGCTVILMRAAVDVVV